MTVSKESGILFILLGTVLILSALSLSLWNRRENELAQSQSAQVLDALQDCIPTSPPPAGPEIPTETTFPEQTRPMEMETITMDGNEYIGFLAIPALELELPVMAQWSYPRLQIAPCRESGGTASDDLVIAAHNFDSHFGRLRQLQPGDLVTFTEVDGFLNSYRAETCLILQPEQVEQVLLSGYDLVLYTCTKGGATRVVLYCNREEPSE